MAIQNETAFQSDKSVASTSLLFGYGRTQAHCRFGHISDLSIVRLYYVYNHCPSILCETRLCRGPTSVLLHRSTMSTPKPFCVHSSVPEPG